MIAALVLASAIQVPVAQPDRVATTPAASVRSFVTRLLEIGVGAWFPAGDLAPPAQVPKASSFGESQSPRYVVQTYFFESTLPGSIGLRLGPVLGVAYQGMSRSAKLETGNQTQNLYLLQARLGARLASNASRYAQFDPYLNVIFQPTAAILSESAISPASSHATYPVEFGLGADLLQGYLRPTFSSSLDLSGAVTIGGTRDFPLYGYAFTTAWRFHL